MTNSQTELEAAVHSLIEDGQRRSGGPPSPEELAKYQQGTMSEQEAERFEELLAHYPESVRLLVGLGGYPYEGKPGDLDYLSDDEMKQDWQAIEDRLSPRSNTTSIRPLTRLQRIARQTLPMAASFLAALLGSVWFYRSEITDLSRQVSQLQSPQTEVSPQLLIPDGLRNARGGESVIRLSQDSQYHFLTLSLFETPSFRDFRLELHNPADHQGKPLWSKTGLRLKPDDTLEILLPRAFLSVSTAELHLYGIDKDAEELLATYSLEQ